MAYAMMGETLFAASAIDILVKALNGLTFSQGAGHKSIRSAISSGHDEILFSDNNSSIFVGFLRHLEVNWPMSFMLVSDYLQWMGSSFELADSQHVSNLLLIPGADGSYTGDIRDDAELPGKTIKCKPVVGKNDYENDAQVDGKTVVLTFEISGPEPL